MFLLRRGTRRKIAPYTGFGRPVEQGINRGPGRRSTRKIVQFIALAVRVLLACLAHPEDSESRVRSVVRIIITAMRDAERIRYRILPESSHIAPDCVRRPRVTRYPRRLLFLQNKSLRLPLNGAATTKKRGRPASIPTHTIFDTNFRCRIILTVKSAFGNTRDARGCKRDTQPTVPGQA